MMDWMEAGSRETSGRTCGTEMTEGGGGGKRRLLVVVLVDEEVAIVRVRVRVVVVRRREDECISLFERYSFG